jgi:carbonic anhydrase
MSTVDELVANNRAFACASSNQRAGDARPSRRVAVITCMDARIDVLAVLGLQPGEAHVLRNAGGIVTDDVLRSLVISQRRLDTREVMLIHHTCCGMQALDEDELRAELQRAAGATPAWAFGSFADLDADVRQSIARVRDCPFLAHRDRVRGFVYDVAARLLREVAT